MKNPISLQVIAVSAALLTTSTSCFAANTIWSGAGGNDNWSTAGNWSGATPAGNAVQFYDPDATGGGEYGAANNIVDTSIRVESLRYGNTNGFHNTSIPAGVTLTVESTNSTMMYVGTGADNGAVQTVYASVQGEGSLLVTNTSGSISVIQGSASSGAKLATLDMASLNNFTAYVSQIRVAAENGGSGSTHFNRPAATLLLAKTNFIYASGNPGLRVSWTSGNGGPGVVKLGLTNAIFANNGINIGDRKSTGDTRLEFNSMLSYPTPVALFRDQAGTGRQNLWLIGDQYLQNSGSTPATGTIDFSGGLVDALVNTITVGRGANSPGTGTGNGTLTIGAGVVDANTVNVGMLALGPGVGTVNVNTLPFVGIGVLKVNNTLRLTTAASAACQATVNVNGGSLYANTIENGGGAIADLAINDGTLAVTNAAGTPASPLLNISLRDATILLPARAGATNIFVTTLTSNPSTNNTIGITALPSIAAYPLQVPLISYTVYTPAVATDFMVTFPGLSPAYTGYISNNISQSTLDLVVTDGPPPARELVWKGNVNGNWDTITANWLFGGNASTFNNGDEVSFDDNGVNTTISLVGNLATSETLLVNASKSYTFNGTGAIAGNVLEKDGSGVLTLANTGANTFPGGVQLTNGILRVSGSDDRLPTNCFLTLGDASGVGFELAGVNQTLGGISGSSAAAGLVSLGTSTLTINSGGGSFQGVIQGAGSLVKTGTGAQTLFGANTYAGGTRVTGGSLVVANTAGSGTGTGPVQVETNATFTLGAGNAGGSVAVSTITNHGTVVLNRNDEFTFDKLIVGDGGLTKNNTAGRAIIATANEYQGATTINAGTIRIGQAAALGTTNGATIIANDPSARLELAGNISLAEAITLGQKQGAAGYAPGLLNVSGTNNVDGPITLNTGGTYWIVAADDGKLTINGPIANITTSGNRVLWLSGTAMGEWNSGLTNGTATSNTGLRKDGTGTWTLAGTYDYPNTTVVSNGTLLVNGQIQRGSVHIYGGTLGGEGTINVPVTVYSDGNLAPGKSIGKLTINSSLDLQGKTTMEVSGTGNDQVAVSGALTTGGTLSIVLGGPVFGGEVFQLFTASQFLGGFTLVELPSLPSGMTWNTDALHTAGVVSITGGAPKINVSRNGNQLVFNWSASGYRLLAQTNSLATGLSGNWQPVQGGETSPVTLTIDPASPSVFYRLISP